MMKLQPSDQSVNLELRCFVEQRPCGIVLRLHQIDSYVLHFVLDASINASPNEPIQLSFPTEITGFALATFLDALEQLHLGNESMAVLEDLDGLDVLRVGQSSSGRRIVLGGRLVDLTCGVRERSIKPIYWEYESSPFMAYFDGWELLDRTTLSVFVKQGRDLIQHHGIDTANPE
jgi:hypothetical protein